jgi:hypothetical protein
MLSEGFVQLTQRVENGSHPGPKLSIFIRESRVVAFTV